MTIIQAIFLGALQGVAEFLPISSSGHLALAKEIMELQEVPSLFDVMLHGETLLVVVIVFRDLVIRLCRSLFRWIGGRSDDSDRHNLRLIVTVLVATVITGVMGVVIEQFQVDAYPKVVSGLFIVTGCILIGSKWTRGSRDYTSIGLKEGAVVGFAQGLGVLPGISRSGITISAALFSGMSREKAGEFSFLISIPAVLGALVLKLKDLSEMTGAVSFGALSAGLVTSFFVGLVSLLLLMKLIKGGRFYLFSIYLIPLGIAGLIWL